MSSAWNSGSPATRSQKPPRVLLVATAKRFEKLLTGFRLRAAGHALFDSTSLVLDGDLREDVANAVRGELPWPHVEPEVASREFRFDMGHPVDGALYVLHPCFTDYYLVPADVELRFAREKIAALKDLCAALGAKEISILSTRSLKKRGQFGGEIPLEEIGEKLGLSLKLRDDNNVVLETWARFGEPRLAAHVHPDVQPWLDQEPEFRSLAHNRLHHSLLKAQCTLHLGDQFGLDTKVLATVWGKDISVGGSFQAWGTSTWTFSVTFWAI